MAGPQATPAAATEPKDASSTSTTSSSSAAAPSASSGSKPAQPASGDSNAGSASKDTVQNGEGKDAAPEEQGDEDVDIGPPSAESVVDMDVFGQLLEIDDDETHGFSKGLAFDYINQADATFGEIEEALSARDLDALSRKGHFLKGSSAALGLQRVQHSCEAMQHYGKRRDARGEGPEVSEDEALARCRVLLRRLKDEQREAKDWLEAFYDPK